MSDSFRVEATSLNVRREPEVRPSNRLAVLPQGQGVERLEGAAADAWWRVQAARHGVTWEGWVARRYLAPASAPTTSPIHDAAVVRRTEALPGGPRVLECNQPTTSSGLEAVPPQVDEGPNRAAGGAKVDGGWVSERTPAAAPPL